MDEPTFSSKACRIYLPPKDTAKRNKKLTKTSAVKECSDSDLLVRMAAQFGARYLQNMLPVFASVINPLAESNERKAWDQLADLVVIELTAFLIGTETETTNGSVNIIPRLSVGFLRTPVHLFNVELGVSSLTTESFHQRLAELIDSNRVDSTLIIVDGSRLTCLGDFSDSIIKTNLESEAELRSEKNPIQALSHLLGPAHCKNILKRSGQIVAPFRVEDAESARSTITFILHDAELVSAEVMENLVRLLYESGARVAIVACYRYLSSASSPSSFQLSCMISHVKNISSSTLGYSAEQNVLTFLKNSSMDQLVLGPNVIRVLLSELALLNGSVKQMNIALKTCCIQFYTHHYLPSEALTKLDHSSDAARALFARLRNLDSFRDFIATETAENQIRLLLDDLYFLKFLRNEVYQRDQFRLAVVTLLTVVTELLSSVTSIPWWDVYIDIMTGKNWSDCVKLQHISADVTEGFWHSLKQCIKLLAGVPELEGGVTTKWVRDLENYQKKNHTEANQSDVLKRWQQKSRQGSPLIALLTLLCGRMPSYKSIVFHETMMFDDVSLLRERLCCDLRNHSESVVQDPGSVFPVKENEGKSFRPDISLVRSSLMGDRRSLNLLKSMSAYQKKLSETEEDVPGDKSAATANSFSEAARARFMSSLPSLQALGILSLAQKGQKSTFTIV